MNHISMNSLGELFREHGLIDTDDLTPTERELVELATKFITDRNTGRIRVYINQGIIIVSTEFRRINADKKTWKMIYRCASKCFANINVIDQSPNVDHSWQDGPDGNKINEKFGPYHGMIETQVDVHIPIPNPTSKKIKKAIARLEKATEPIWEIAGICII